MTGPATGGVSTNATNNSQPAPGSLFGWPKYGTQRRFVPDQGNGALGATPLQGTQVNVQTTRLDQLDIVTGIKLYATFVGRWTNTGSGLANSSFFPAAIYQQITVKLQAAYSTYNLPGSLAAIIQAFRPMWGNRQLGPAYPNTVAQLGLAAAGPTYGSTLTQTHSIDIPFSFHFDEYFDLDIEGAPTRQLYDVIVSPMYMAAQARSVTPTITLAPMLSTLDGLGAPVTRPSSDSTSTFTLGSWSGAIQRDAFWTANSPLANPPQFPWLYTRDFFTQPTNGQPKVGVLIQNTGVSVGQVLSLWGFVWDPAANSGLGAVVPYTSITSFELIQGGSLQSIYVTPQMMEDRIRRMYGIYQSTATASFPSGIFIFDFAIEEDGAVITNKNAINTYLVNGVQVNIQFVSGSVPGSTAVVYMGVEALKYATS